MTMAMSVAVERGAKLAICASTGNTSASAAAYAARAGLVCAVVLPAGHIALGKLAQALIHGAQLVPIHGNFDDALDDRARARHATGRRGRELGEPSSASRGRRRPRSKSSTSSATRPPCTAIPVGNAGNITAYWRGYTEYHALGRATRCRACSVGRRRDRRRSCSASRCCIPRRIATAIRSAIRRRGRARSPRATSRAATSARSPTPRSSTATGSSPPKRAASSSRRRRRRWPGCSQAATEGLRRARRHRGVHRHRPRAEGSGAGDHRGAGGRGGRRHRRRRRRRAAPVGMTTALVTGATAGIGRAFVDALAAPRRRRRARRARRRSARLDRGRDP